MRLMTGLFLAFLTIGSGVLLAAPEISVKSQNTAQVALYEKYEVVLALSNAVYSNPYDPEEIDVRAVFTAPSGRQWPVYAFYDDYANRKQWKVRFSPNETGTWTYYLQAGNALGTGRSIDYSFQAVPSGHPGWLRISDTNPHYFAYDDGSPFYGVAVYWPWRIQNNENGLAALQNAGVNLVGYWNVTYDDGTLIESMTSGLGRYDQNKCNRIDNIIQWMEQRGMVLMLAIWPHDLFCQNMPGWAALWNQNPYKQLCSVVEIYENEPAWRYQEKQYRYIIARWGYSRGLGIWEIMNEINGTDAWAAGRIAAAENWTRKVHEFLTRHDPFGRPTTVSMSGGHYWNNGYAICDVPNVHIYESGWTPAFNNNPLRSSLWTYRKVTRQLWNDYRKPAIMGEAGWLDNYGGFAGDSDEYAMMYHNALWSSWSSGLASTPVWWAYDARVMGPKVMERLRKFSAFAPGVPAAQPDLTPLQAVVPGADAFAMGTRETAFGWIRDEWGKDISRRTMKLGGVADSVYAVEWYDPWKGEIVATHMRPCRNGELLDELPHLTTPAPDLAFILQPAETGTQPARLGLFAHPRALYADGRSEAEIVCLIFDDQERFCSAAANTVTFQSTGPGRLVGNPVRSAQGGFAAVTLRSDSLGNGLANIIVSSPGLRPDTVSVSISDLQPVDDFESYGSLNALDLFWKPVSGTVAVVTLQTGAAGAGEQALQVDYSIGNGKPPFAGVAYALPRAFKNANYLRFWLRGDASQRSLVIKFNQTSSVYWQHQTLLDAAEERWIEIPLSLFVPAGGTAPLDMARITSLSFNILPGDGGMGSGTILVDEIALGNSSMTGIDTPPGDVLPETFFMSQNYPNPFNSATEYAYALPRPGRVELSIYNLTGQRVTELVQAWQGAGLHRVCWRADAHPSGVYWAVLRSGGEVQTRKSLLLR